MDRHARTRDCHRLLADEQRRQVHRRAEEHPRRRGDTSVCQSFVGKPEPEGGCESVRSEGTGHGHERQQPGVSSTSIPSQQMLKVLRLVVWSVQRRLSL